MAKTIKNIDNIEFKSGDKVVLKKNAMMSTILKIIDGKATRVLPHNIPTKIYSIMDKNWVRLERKLGGYWTWNVDNLDKKAG